jgi:hypothetical protein
MQAPFTADQFFEVFRQYNESVWPAQFALILLAVTAVALARRGTAHDSRTVSAILALLWFWMAVAYALFFRPLGAPTYAFAALFAVQGALFASLAISKQRALGAIPAKRMLAGALLIVYALILYPALGIVLGHTYPASPTFGLPCPTTILTFAILLWGGAAMPKRLLVIPVLWTIVGTSAAFMFGVYEDLGLVLAAIVTLALLLPRQTQAASLGGTFKPAH